MEHVNWFKDWKWWNENVGTKMEKVQNVGFKSAFMPIDISSFKCVHMWLKNKSYDGVTLNLNVSIQACDHESIQAYEYLSA